MRIDSNWSDNLLRYNEAPQKAETKSTVIWRVRRRRLSLPERGWRLLECRQASSQTPFSCGKKSTASDHFCRALRAGSAPGRAAQKIKEFTHFLRCKRRVYPRWASTRTGAAIFSQQLRRRWELRRWSWGATKDLGHYWNEISNRRCFLRRRVVIDRGHHTYHSQYLCWYARQDWECNGFPWQLEQDQEGQERLNFGQVRTLGPQVWRPRPWLDEPG